MGLPRVQLLQRGIHAVITRARFVVITFVLLFFPATFAATQLPLDGDLISLLPVEVPAVKVLNKLKSWSFRSGTVYVGVVRNEPATVADLKQFAEVVSERIKKSKWARDVTLGVELDALKRSAPLFLDPEDVAEVGKRLKAMVKKERKKRSGMFLDLDDEDEQEDPGPNFDDLVAKYAKRFQWGAKLASGASSAKGVDAADAATAVDSPKEATSVAGGEGAGDGGSGEDGNKGGLSKGAAAIAQIRESLNADASQLYYISKDRRMLIFALQANFPRAEADKYPLLVADAEAAFAHARKTLPNGKHIDTYFGGAYALDWDQRTATIDDFRFTTIFAGVLILLVTIITLRRLLAIALVYVSLLIGMGLTFGAAYVFIGSVNFITVFLLAILGGLGIDFGLYFATRYALFRSEGLGRNAAVVESWLQTAIPAGLSAMTTAAVFILVAFGRFKGFSELGIISAVGVGLTYLTMYTFLPACFVLFDSKGGDGETGDAASGDGASGDGGPGDGDVVSVRDRVKAKVIGAASSGGLAKLNPTGKLARFFVPAALLLTVVMAISARDVIFAYTGEELTSEGASALDVDRKIVEHYGENIDPTLVLAESPERGRAIQRYFTETFGEHRDISRYESVFQFLPDPDKQKAALEAMDDLRWAIKRLPKKSEDDPDLDFVYKQLQLMADPKVLTLDMLPTTLTDRYIPRKPDGSVGAYLGLIIPKGWLWELGELNRFVASIEKLEVDGKKLQMTGRPQIFLSVIEIVRDDTVVLSVVGMVLIFLLFWVQARRIRFAVLSMLPLVAGLIWMLGCLPWIGEHGIHLSFLNLIVFPILVGLGVSYGVHMVFGYRLYGNAATALRVNLLPILGSSATTLVGWSALLFASMIGLRGMGWIAVLGMSCMTLFSLLILPAAMKLLEDRGWIRGA